MNSAPSCAEDPIIEPVEQRCPDVDIELVHDRIKHIGKVMRDSILIGRSSCEQRFESSSMFLVFALTLQP
jgi:hypothetical protein